ncbi:MAG: heme exporter protein CcmD [Burkholderiales bacterium]|jgi:heme exporter protein D
MNWGGFGNFVHMGGYAFYVWGSYLMGVLCIAGELVLLARRARLAERRA